MKHILAVVLLLLVAFAGSMQAEDGKLGLDLSLEFDSFYAFRGGPNFVDRVPSGIIMPSVGYAAGDLYLLVSAEIAPSILGLNTLSATGYGDGASNDEKALTGIDFGLSWGKGFADDFITLGAEVWFLFYPNSKKYYGYNSTYFTGTVSLQLSKLPLAPKLSFTQAFKPDDNHGTRNKFEDRYISLSVEHSIELIKNLSDLELGLNIGYWMDNTDNKELAAFSDVVAKAKYSINIASGLSLWSSLNFGYVPQSDWAMGKEGGDFRFWIKLGINYSI